MVCGFMLANHIDEKNASPIMQYLGRMIMEMQVLTMRAAKARPDAAHALTGNQDYNNWMVKNSQLLLAARE
jgi:hypothetical protein